MLPNLIDIYALDLGPLTPRPNPLTGNPNQASAVLWRSPDSRVEIGVWECTPGRFASSRKVNSEFSLILEGEAVLHDSKGLELTLQKGASVNLHLGWSGEWDIIKKVRKLYITTAV